MDLTIETLIKYATGIAALGTAFLALIGFIFNKNLKIITINEIDQLFLEKTQQKNLQIWRFIMGNIQFIILNISVTVLLYLVFESFHIYANWIGIIAFVLLIIWGFFFTKILVSALRASKSKKINKTKFNDTFMSTMISGTFVHSILFSYSFFIDPSVKTIITALFFFIIVFHLYSIIINKHKIKVQSEYSVSLVSEAKIKTEKLKHGYIIDNKRTVYFSEFYENTEVFFICDFDSKVYLKYTKIINENKNEDDMDTVTTHSN
ncbi:hypothetical protein B4117_2151 [Bacillus mycoides]|uniref:hypothetical protein n=1 Tax=Bacillus mycoides TaxID=1405 RepID=UPI0007AB275E|nr:hypothetical protein [Bacillus mycoides]KZE06273.1 hypothetical protein B4117_2151 [Bacillus mycoides]